jgi:CRP-like cAMP-binding protein
MPIVERDKQFPRTNFLLAALPDATYELLLPFLERVPLPFREVLQEPNKLMPYVYFPLSGVVSQVVIMEDGTVVEVATIGNEGVVGLPIFWGGDTIPAQYFVQVPGEALRMSSQRFKELSRSVEQVRTMLEFYTQAIFVFVAQSAACNRTHSIKQRCARWLITTQDRVGADQFPLTQEFLGQMLGVRRAGVNEVATELQHDGLIDYNRGTITITNRQGLEEQACECYHVIRNEFRRSFELMERE